MREEELASIVEVREVGSYSEANQYLAVGYRLLHIDSKAVARQRPDKQSYVMRRVAFIIGRTADVEHTDIAPYYRPVPLEQPVVEA